MKQQQSGFTIMEVLVVISVMSLMASIILFVVSDARMKGRDAKRIADVRQLQKALDLYFDDNGYYPQSACGWDCNGYRVSYTSSWDLLAADLSPYLVTIPQDPIGGTCPAWQNGCYTIAYGNVGRTSNEPGYDLLVQLEDPNHPLRCELNDYKWYFDDRSWCTAHGGSYSNQIFSASPR